MASAIDDINQPDFERLRTAILRVPDDHLREELSRGVSNAEARILALEHVIDNEIRIIQDKTEKIKVNLNLQDIEMELTKSRISDQEGKVANLRKRLRRNIFEAALVAISLGLFANVMAEYGRSLFILIESIISSIFITKANAIEASQGLISISKDYILLSVLGVVSIIYIACFVIMVFVSEKDSKDFAKDIIKTITGFYLGLITKGF